MQSILLYVVAALALVFVTPEKTKPEVCLSAEEVKIYEQLNAYRKLYKLPKIPLSASMTIVAQAHAKDLQTINLSKAIATCTAGLTRASGHLAAIPTITLRPSACGTNPGN
jgi:uncharacterized protein YkwD